MCLSFKKDCVNSILKENKEFKQKEFIIWPIDKSFNFDNLISLVGPQNTGECKNVNTTTINDKYLDKPYQITYLCCLLETLHNKFLKCSFIMIITCFVDKKKDKFVLENALSAA